MKTTSLVIAGLAGFAASARADVFVSHERMNDQTSDSGVVLRDVKAYAEIDGVSGITAATVSGGGFGGSTALTQVSPTYWEAKSAPYATGAALAVDFPANTPYTVSWTGASGSPVTLTSPASSLGNYYPGAPVFTLSGVSGTWSTFSGRGVFTFDATTVSSFTVSLNAYQNPTTTGAQRMAFADVEVSGTTRADVSDIPGSGAPDTGLLSLTFTTDLVAANASATDALVGFSAGEFLDVGAGFVNASSFNNAGSSGGLEAFALVNRTEFTLAAIPEPSAYGACGAAALAGVVAVRRRRRVR